MNSFHPDIAQTLIQNFPKARILCLGDVMMDTFNEGQVKRISPESPVPVFNSGTIKNIPGGAANVARNISALGAYCTLLGMVGDDAFGHELGNLLAKDPNISPILVKASDRPTPHKIRYVVQGQHMFRVDTEISAPARPEVEEEIMATLKNLIAKHDILVLSDYAKGLLTDDIVSCAIAMARAAGKKIVVDPKSRDFSKYMGATLLTPNAKEILEATGISANLDADAERAGRFCLETANIDAILITRGRKGMSLVQQARSSVHILNEAREVFDVVGAGDTGIATLAVALAIDAGMETAARLANMAAGIVVEKRGTATVAPDELLNRVSMLHAGGLRHGAPVMLTVHEAETYAQARRAEGKKVGFTNGVFDIVHPGHISILQYSRNMCDCLIVGLNSDASAHRLGKGPDRPVNAEADRATVLGAFGTVDAVVVFDTDTPLELIKNIKPDVLIKGADYSVENVVGSDIVLEYGGEVKLAPLVPGKSSTKTIDSKKCRAK